jgi:hypothetical protein
VFAFAAKWAPGTTGSPGEFAKDFTDSFGGTTSRWFPAGPKGGKLVCGLRLLNNATIFVCAWSDRLAAGGVLYSDKAVYSLPDAASKTVRIRSVIER